LIVVGTGHEYPAGDLVYGHVVGLADSRPDPLGHEAVAGDLEGFQPVGRGERHVDEAALAVDRDPVGGAAQGPYRADLLRTAGGDAEQDHRVAFGVRHVEQAVRGRANVGRADADRGRAERTAIRCVRLDLAAPYPDDHDRRAIECGGDTAGLHGRGLDGDLPAAAHQGHRVRVLIAHEGHRAHRGRVVRLVADVGVRDYLAARQGDLEQLVDLLRGNEDRARGSGELQVPRPAGQSHDQADPPGRDVHQRHPVGPVQADRDDAVGVVHRQPLGGTRHRHHRAGRPPRQRRRSSRFWHVGPHRSGSRRGTGSTEVTSSAASGGYGYDQHDRYHPAEYAHSEERRHWPREPPLPRQDVRNRS